MKCLIILSLACAALPMFPVVSAQGLNEVRERIESIKDLRSNTLPDWAITHSMEISEYYANLAETRSADLPSNWREILLTLGESVGIEAVMEDYYSHLKDGSLFSGNPCVACLSGSNREFILPYLYSDVYYGTTRNGVRWNAVLLVADIIRNSTRFPKETRIWGEEILKRLGGAPVAPFLNSIQFQLKEWLFFNRQAVLAGKYEQATWLPDEPPTEENFPAVSQKIPEATHRIGEKDENPVVTKLVADAAVLRESRANGTRFIAADVFFATRMRERPERKPQTREQKKAWQEEGSPYSWFTIGSAILLVIATVIFWRFRGSSGKIENAIRRGDANR